MGESTLFYHVHQDVHTSVDA